MPQYGTWIAFSGWGEIVLLVILLTITVLLLILGNKLKHPITFAFPGRVMFVLLLLIWILSNVMFLNNTAVYIIQLIQKSMVGIPPFNPVSYVTYPSILITFIVIFILNRKSGLLIALYSAFICAIAATMIFELPFDLIIISTTYPPIPPSPLLFRGLFFLPLFLIEITTLALLTFSPLMKITKYTFYSLAGMFSIFTLWSMWGFAYPSTAIVLGFNIISKILAFITAITLFYPQKSKSVRLVKE
ncbi:MAG TPA: hypothetical protein VLF89_08785 [Candidatus Saccharimonadales bacterium]|nr:hypothetical protein [Candidatus Saccharimonadales bacterium]